MSRPPKPSSASLVAPYVDNLELFCEVAEHMEDENKQNSLRGIVKAINERETVGSRFRNVTVYMIESSISWLEAVHKTPLVMRVPGSGNNSLTEEGRKLYRIGRRVIASIRRLYESREESGPLHIAVSRMILNQVIPDIIRDALIDSSDEKSRFNILRAEFDDGHDTGDTILRLNDESLEFAILWATEDRLRQIDDAQPPLKYEPFDHQFELLCVFAPDHRFADFQDRPIPWKEIRAEQVYQMSAGHLPPKAEQILSPEFSNDVFGDVSVDIGKRIIVEDYEMALKYISMGMKGVALVPSIFRYLDRMKRAKHIAFAHVEHRPAVTLMAVYRDLRGEPSMSQSSREILEIFREHIRTLPQKSGWEIEATLPLAEESGLQFSNIDNFCYAYYLRANDSSRQKPLWRKARMRVIRCSGEVVEGVLTHERLPELTYSFKGQRIGKVLLLCTSPKEGDRYWDVGHSTVTLNTMFRLSGNNGQPVTCLAGLWVGQDWSNQPAAGPFLLATDHIDANKSVKMIVKNFDDLIDLNGISRISLLRVFASINARPNDESF